MKKTLIILGKISIGLLIAIGLLIGLFNISRYISRKQLDKEMIEKSKECALITNVTAQPELYLLEFNDFDLQKLKFEIIRDNKVVKDSVILGNKNEKPITSIRIPFNTFLKSDTILLTTNTNLQYYISNFRYGVHQNWGMFGPVAISECTLLSVFTINEEPNTKRIIKYFGKLASDKNEIQRIYTGNSNYEKIIKKYNINKKLSDSIGEEICREHIIAGNGTDWGIEINKKGIYFIRSFIDENYDKIIIKINTKTGERSRALMNYPLENE